MARAFAEAGADVFICSRNAHELDAAAAEVGRGLRVRVEWLVTDTADRSQVEPDNVLQKISAKVLDNGNLGDILFGTVGYYLIGLLFALNS